MTFDDELREITRKHACSGTMRCSDCDKTITAIKEAIRKRLEKKHCDECEPVWGRCNCHEHNLAIDEIKKGMGL